MIFLHLAIDCESTPYDTEDDSVAQMFCHIACKYVDALCDESSNALLTTCALKTLSCIMSTERAEIKKKNLERNAYLKFVNRFLKGGGALN